MKKTSLLFIGLLLATILVIAPLFSAAAQDTMPAPIDPQSWTMPRDTNWSNFKPNPVIDWRTEHNPATLYNPSRHAGGNANFGIPEHRKTPINGAIILVDFYDKPFLMLGEENTDLFGWHIFEENDSYSDYLAKIDRGDPVTKNPQRVVDGEAALRKFWEDYLNQKITDPTDIAFNHGTNTDDFWREVSYGKWAVDLTAFGPYHLEGLELEYGFSYVSSNDHPPSLRRSGSRNLVNDSLAAANAHDVWIGDYDFFFVCHSGYDQSGVWQEFGQVQWANGADVPYQYGPKAKMDELEILFTEHPEYVVAMDARGGYTQATMRTEADKIKAHQAAGTLSEYEFKFPATDWTWANNYIGQGSQPGTPGGSNTSPTRYVKWTSWAAGMTKWASSSGYSGTTVTSSNGSRVTNIPYSQQAECNGMATYAHEFGHIVNLPDNYSAPYSDSVSARTEPWDLMSRGCFAGPFGDHARWSVPGGLEADSVPVHLMFVSKKFSNFYDPGDVKEITVAQLKAGTPLVTEVVARNIPMNNAGEYPQLENYGLIAPNFYKAVELTFDSANADRATLVTTGWSNTRTRATRMSIEVVERTGYDSYAPDDGVIISRLTSGSGSYQVIDSHLDNRIQTMHDYYLNGDPVGYPIAHQVHLMDGAFKAGKSFTDTGYYVGGEYKGDKRGIAGKEPAASEIISGNTVNEYYDAANGLHYYILERHDNPGKVSTFLSYSVGILHDSGLAVGGELEVGLAGVERETPLKVAVASFDITNTGDATDIIRVGVDGYLEGVLLNDLYAIGAGETITVPVYVQLPGDIRTRNLSSQSITLTASSESNGAKIGQASVIVNDLIDFNYHVYLVPDQDGIYAGETVFVDVMLSGDLNYSQISTEIAYDTNLLKYEGYTNLQGIVAAVSPLAGKVSVRSIPSLNMITGEPCDPAVKIVTLKFSGLGNFTTDKIDTALSLASIVVNPPAGFVGGGTAPGVDMPLIIYDNDFTKSFYNNLKLYPDWIGLDEQGLPTTMPIFSMSAASSYIVERVWVEVPVDTDRDGRRDRVSLYIRRPRTLAGFKCPVVMEFSPYHNGTVAYNRVGNANNNSVFDLSTDPHVKDLQATARFWPNYNVNLQANPDTTHLTYDDIKYKGTEAWDPIWWKDQGAFTVDSWYTGITPGAVPAATIATATSAATTTTSWSPPARWSHYFVRGYAVVYGQLLGNQDCYGITNTLHAEEWVSAAAAAKWFNGEAKAYTTRTSTVEVTADWASGLVAMDGTSYPGTTPVVTAMAGVTGLKAIMPEANVTSWYEYYRSGGALHGPEGYGGEDMNLHSSYNFSRFNADSSSGIPSANGTYFGMAAQLAYVQTQKYMMEGEDRATGDYNVEWDARNLTRGYGQIPNDMGILQTNGQQDWNVMPRHAYEMLQGLRDNFGGYDSNAYGTHKLVSSLSKHASQTSRLVMGKDGVERGMLKWYLMFLDHFMLRLDNKVDELMYDVNIANQITGVMEGYDYDTAVEERGTIIPGIHYEKIYLAPAAAGKAGRLSYTQPAAAVEHFDDLTIDQQIAAPQHVGAPNRPTSWINVPASQGNQTPTTAAINYCDDRVIGVNRTTTNFGTYGSLSGAVDRPVDGRLIYLSDPLAEDTMLSGTPVVHLNMAPTKGTGNLTVALVEIGRKQRVAVRIESVSTATTGSTVVFPTVNGANSTSATRYANPPHASNASTSNFKYVTWGHTDAQNPSYDGKAWFEVPEQNYIPNYYFQTTLLNPGTYYDYVVELNPYNYLFKAGMQIGVIVYGTDTLASPCLDAATTGGFDVQLGAGSYISLPLSKAVALESTVEPVVEIIEIDYHQPVEVVEVIE